MLLATAALGAAPIPPETQAAVEQALVTAAVRALGPDSDVRLDDVRIAGVTAGTAFVATIEAAGRTGRSVSFSLASTEPGQPARRVGSAVARVLVSGPHPVATRALPRGTVLSAGDVRDDLGPVSDVPFHRLPSASALVGAKLTRDVAAGATLSAGLAQAVPLVRSGDVVTVRIVIDGIEAQGRAVASQNGAPGDVIRVVNPDSHRALVGRVTADGQVEVIHAS